MDSNKQSAAMYLAGHGSFTRPRLIELQYRRIQRYREALCDHLGIASSVPTIFVDFRLPTYGMGSVNLIDVPGFRRLYRCVKNGRFDIVFVDLDDTRERLTPDYEFSFVRSLLEGAGAKVFNAFSDDGAAFKSALRSRCGDSARDYEVTDGTDIVCFFPSLASDITATSLRRELQNPDALQSGYIDPANRGIAALRSLRPYNGGKSPFIEDRLSAEWKKPNA
jgi:hypothetical protein